MSAWQAIKKVISFLGFQSYLGSSMPTRKIYDHDEELLEIIREQVEKDQKKQKEDMIEREKWRRKFRF